MATILCIETTTTNCSVALFKHGTLLAAREDNDKNYAHAEKLHLFIEQLLVETQTDLDDLDAVAVSKGPGSYTGLRIGVSATKGLCFSLDIPLIGIDTLTALAMQVTEPEGYIIPMLDARRMEVYTAVFDSGFEIQMPVSAVVLDENSFFEYLNQSTTTFIGNSNDKLRQVVQHFNTNFIDDCLPTALNMGRLAEEKFNKKDFENLAYFEPYYLKDFISG